MEAKRIGEILRQKRESAGLTQAQVAERVGVTPKAVSKWETGAGLPDVTLFSPLSAALSVSVAELFAGETVNNGNRAAHMRRAVFYVCPACGNVAYSVGELAASCCGAALLPLAAQAEDAAHAIEVTPIEDEWFLQVKHPMEKDHFLSFAAFVQDDRVSFVKWYPEGEAQARFERRGHGTLYVYCVGHGLFSKKI